MHTDSKNDRHHRLALPAFNCIRPGHLHPHLQMLPQHLSLQLALHRPHRLTQRQPAAHCHARTKSCFAQARQRSARRALLCTATASRNSCNASRMRARATRRPQAPRKPSSHASRSAATTTAAVRSAPEAAILQSMDSPARMTAQLASTTSICPHRRRRSASARTNISQCVGQAHACPGYPAAFMAKSDACSKVCKADQCDLPASASTNAIAPIAIAIVISLVFA
jgi:hypothetical protein